MADKEERIIIAVAEPSLLEGGADKIYPCMTRREAINKIAAALCVADGVIDCDECIYRGTDNCKTQLKNWYLKDAEVALDALLGDK